MARTIRAIDRASISDCFWNHSIIGLSFLGPSTRTNMPDINRRIPNTNITRGCLHLLAPKINTTANASRMGAARYRRLPFLKNSNNRFITSGFSMYTIAIATKPMPIILITLSIIFLLNLFCQLFNKLAQIFGHILSLKRELDIGFDESFLITDIAAFSIQH